jgi:NAD(P)-dependent dehydrogenase (short-subunit alcohol dehydrogenase family)
MIQMETGRLIEGGIMEIENSTALITGGASGLGAATARELVRKGGNIVILDVDKEKGEKFAKELGNAATFFALDIREEKEIDKVIEQIRGVVGTFHIVINCAGVGGSFKILGKEGITPLERFNHTIQINLIGTLNVIRATLSTLVANTPNNMGERGVYINTSSIAAFDGQIGQAAYASSKGGVVSLALPLAREFAPNGIRVMTILPGIMDTPLLANVRSEVRASLSQQVPFPSRLGKPEEFSSLVCEIVKNSYLNGEFIRLDGGLRMGFSRREK